MKITIINEDNGSKITLNNASLELVNKFNDDETIKTKLVGDELLVTTNDVNFWCIVFGHAWVDNVCARCGMTR